jgi:PAS domain S-box-containing protein
MPLLRHRSIASQIRLALGLLAVLMTLGSVGMLLLARRATENASRLYLEHLRPLQQLNTLAEAYSVAMTGSLRAVRSGALAPPEGLAELHRDTHRAETAWRDYRADHGPSPGVLHVESHLQNLRELTRRLETLLPQGVSAELGTFGDRDWLPEVIALSRGLGDLREEQDRTARILIENLQAQSRRTTWIGLALMAAALLLALGLSQAFARHLQRGVGDLVGRLRRVADGNLEPAPERAGEDELAVADRELNRTVARLDRLMATLREQQALERAILDGAQAAIIGLDLEGKVNRFNHAAEVMLGYRAEEVLGQATPLLWRLPEELARLAEELSTRMRRPIQPGVEALQAAAHIPGFSSECHYRHRDGHLVPVLLVISRILSPEGRLLGTMGVALDLTEIKRLQAELQASEARAQAASRAKSAFLASMSHELRTPLTAILGYTRLMAREPARSEDDRVRLGHVVRAGEHLLSLINDVLSLSKIEAGRMELKPVRFEPAALFRDLESLLRTTAQGKGLNLEVDAGGFPDQVEGDLPKLRQVLLNLLGNALKFTEAGHVRLRAHWREDRATFAVEDTGPGIAPEDQARLFQAFSQTEQGASAGGTGLGLHISQLLVGLLGGRLALDSAPGQGSSFSFALPLPEVEGPLLRPGERSVGHLAAGQGQPRLLVVDDRPENRDTLCGLLRLVGFQCREAVDGAEGVSRWEQDRPDLVLMDLRMPVMDGFAALEALRRREAERDWPRTPVVAISASVYDVDPRDLAARGFDGFLTKPIDEASLFQTLGTLLGLAFVEAAPAGAPAPSAGLAGAAGLDPDWRARFRSQLTVGDLEAAERLLDELPDSPLKTDVRQHLRAYHLKELLQHIP